MAPSYPAGLAPSDMRRAVGLLTVVVRGWEEGEDPPESDSDSEAVKACARGWVDGLPSLGRGWGVAPPNALCKFMATPSPGVGGAIEGPGEPSTVDISFTSRRCRGWGVGIFIRGRVVELTIERRKDFRRV